MKPEDPKIIIVLPAYNAARTLERTYADLPKDKIYRIILVDDVSRDETVEIARSLGLSVVIHVQNLGYGGNQKNFNITLSEVISRHYHDAIFGKRM